jgi:hypothetical protein
MPLQVRCDNCDKEYRLADEMAGKTLRCKQCNAAFVAKRSATGITSAPPAAKPPTRPAPAKKAPVQTMHAELVDDDGDDRPRRKTRPAPPPRPARGRHDDDDDDVERRPRKAAKAGSSTGLFIGLGIGGGVLLLGLVGLLIWQPWSGDPRQAAVNPPPAGGGANVPNANLNANPNHGQPNAGQPNPGPALVVGKGDILPAAVQPFPFFPPNPAPPPQKQNSKNKREVELPAKAVGEWKVEVDPPPVATHDVKPGQLQPAMAGNSKFFISSAPGAQSVLVRAPTRPQPVLAGVNFGKLQVVPLLPVQDYDLFAFHPEGNMIAATKANFFEGVVVMPPLAKLPKGQVPYTIPIPKTARERHLEFLADDRLLITYMEGLAPRFDLVDWKNKQVVKSIVTANDHRPGAIAVSPGRKYFAHAGEKDVRVYKAATGDLVGTLGLDKDRPAHAECRGLAFSLDGTELALYFNHQFKNQLACWDVKTGNTLVHHVLDKELPNPNTFNRSHVLQFLPDKSGWLANSQVIVDRVSGLIAHEFPDGRNHYRRILGEHVLHWREEFQSTSAEVQPLPKAEIEAGMAKLRQSAADATALASLPELKPADFSQTKIPVANVNAANALTVEPAAPLPPQVGLQALTLPTTKSQDVLQIVFSGNQAAKAAVVHLFTENPVNPRKQVRVARLDLASGKSDAVDLLISQEIQNRSNHRHSFMNPPGLVIPTTLDMVAADLSHDGNMLALRHIDFPNRLDVWDLSTKKHLTGWLPYGEGGNPVWFGFTDKNTLLTLDAGGKLIGWKVPERQALFAVDNVRGVPAFSPQRKALTALVGVNLAIIETGSGDLKGILSDFKGSVTELFAAAFSNDGQELAAVVRRGAETALVRYHLGKRQIVAELPAEPTKAGMQWVSPNHVMFGLSLVDWSFRGGALYQYTMPNESAMVTNSPDQRFWLAQLSGNNAVLKPFTMPEPQAQEFAALLIGGPSQPLLTKGDTLSVTVNAANDKFRDEVQTALENSLRNKGFQIGPGGVTLTVGAEEVQNGRTVEFEVRQGFAPIGPRFGNIGPRGQIINVKDRDIKCTYLVTSAAGEKLVDQKHVVPLPRNVRTKEGEDFEAQVVQQMWDQATFWGRAVPPPTNMYRVGGVVHSVPRRGAFPGT